MSINANGALPIAAMDRPAREPRLDEPKAAEPFAGVFASAMVAHALPPKPAPKPHDGTSELDGSDTPDDSGTTTTSAKDATHDAATDPTSTAAPATATVSASTVPVATDQVVRMMTALDPTLQQKLARVISRVHDETGHDVTVTETYRPQSRQDALFAQGRETPGPVVTWTQSSKHTQGRAVDVTLDGGKAGPGAYAALQRIAREEGLTTLGARDPGHLELPGTGAPARSLANVLAGVTTGTTATTDATAAEPANAVVGQGQVSLGRLAQVAQVTDLHVAKPAQVARVATVARPGAVTAAQPGTVLNVQRGQGQTSQGSGKQAGAGTSDQGAKEGAMDQRAVGAGAVSAYTAARATVLAQIGGTGTGVATDIGTTTADRTAHVIAAIQDAPARPLSQITMNVDTGNGATDRVQLSLRGSTLDATIDTSDPRAAHAMSAQSDQLVRSLAREGIEVESLRVRAAASATPTITAPPAQRSSDSSTGARPDKSNPWQQQDRQRSQSDRRQDKQQQRDERGGQTP